MNPTAPTTRIPSRQILIESHSSFHAGFLACFNSLLAAWKNVRNPNSAQTQQTFNTNIKTYSEICCFFSQEFCFNLILEEEWCMETDVLYANRKGVKGGS